MHSNEMRDELKQLSLKHNVHQDAIKELVYLIFKFVRTIIDSADRDKEYYPTIRLMGLGIFFVSKHKQKRLRDKRIAANDENNSEGQQ